MVSGVIKARERSLHVGMGPQLQLFQVRPMRGVSRSRRTPRLHGSCRALSRLKLVIDWYLRGLVAGSPTEVGRSISEDRGERVVAADGMISAELRGSVVHRREAVLFEGAATGLCLSGERLEAGPSIVISA